MRKFITMLLFCAGALALSTSCNDDFTEINTPSATMQTRAEGQRVESLIQQARAGDSEAYKALALCYRDGDGVKKSWCNMMFCYLIYCEKTGKDFKNIEEIVSEGHPYLYIIRTIDKPISRLAAKEKIAELAQVAPAEAKAIEAVKDLKKIEDAIYRPDIHKALRQAEAEGSETAAMLLAFYLISKERSEEEKAELIRIADKYPYLYQLFDREYIDDCMDGSNIDKLQEMVDNYYRADAHAMLTPAHAGKLCVMRKRLEETGIIAPDEVETARLWSIMERKRN